jgi:hypothetical protein
MQSALPTHTIKDDERGGAGMVEAEADKEIPAAITYSLSWDSPRRAEITLKMSSSRKNPPKSAAPTD